MRLPYLLLIVLLSLSEYISASYKLNFRNIDVQSGISDNYIQSILRDKYGFMWFATLNGLNRYDGYQFKHYTTTQLGSYNNDVESILEDASGTIWIKGPVSYYYYNRELDIIDNKISPILNDYGIEGEVSYLTVDKDFNLWCCVNNTLYYYVFEENNLQSFTLPQNKPVIEIA